MTITVIKETESSYRLTGINMIGDSISQNPVHVPNDTGMARIGGKTNKTWRKTNVKYDENFSHHSMLQNLEHDLSNFGVKGLAMLYMPIAGCSLSESKEQS
jgi:hypothetical protein